jgi:Fe-S cluster assembly protein SufD
MTVVVPPQDLAPRLSGMSLADIAVPNGREENWRFTPLARLNSLHALNDAVSQIPFAVTAPTGVEVSQGDPSVEFPSADRLAAAAATLSDKTLSIEIPTDFNDSEAVLIRTTGISGAATGRIEVKAGKYSKSMVVLDHTGSGSLGIAANFSVAEGGDLTIVSVQDGDRDQVVAAQHAISLGRDAKVNHVVVTLGGDLVRLVTTVNYLDTGGSAVLSGAFFTDAGQHHEHRLFVDHSVPHCSSDVMYKGALQGQDAHSVWIGDVLIRGNAVGTSTYEINRNLLLTEGTRADSVPNLEIETGEIIGAGHASASGRFDEEQMFYLTSRGIPEVQAKRLVVRGFLAEVIERIPATDIRDRLMQGVERRLGDVNPLFDEVSND